MNKQRPLIIAGCVIILLSMVGGLDSAIRWLQIPSGWLASFLLGAPSAIEDNAVRIFTHPQIVVGTACSGTRFFAFVAGLGAGYWCGQSFWRWLALLPISYVVTVFANAARIAMAWQFRRFSVGRIPEWLQEYVHMGIGVVCFLTITAVLLYSLNPPTFKQKDSH